MVNLAFMNNISIDEMQRLQALTTHIKAVGPEFVRNRNEPVIYAGRKWIYDDYIELSYQWVQLAQKAGINTHETKKWLQTEQQALIRLGITLD